MSFRILTISRWPGAHFPPLFSAHSLSMALRSRARSYARSTNGRRGGVPNTSPLASFCLFMLRLLFGGEAARPCDGRQEPPGDRGRPVGRWSGLSRLPARVSTTNCSLPLGRIRTLLWGRWATLALKSSVWMANRATILCWPRRCRGRPAGSMAALSTAARAFEREEMEAGRLSSDHPRPDSERQDPQPS